MEPFERELKQLLTRREPADDFTARVMAAVRAETAEKPGPVAFPGPRRVRRPPVFRWAAVGAMAASLAFGVLAFRQQRAERRAERRAAEQAEMQLIESLSVAGSKISQARDQVWGASRGD